jgi:hypothetical protein
LGDRGATWQFKLTGYYWNKHRDALAYKRSGLDSFCSKLDLLTLRAHPRGRDVIEREFFGDIDTAGAAARDALVEKGPERLTGEERCDFARLMMSLEARRPPVLDKLKGETAEAFAVGLDTDPQILAAMEAFGQIGKPSELYERLTGTTLHDRAVSMVQRLTDNENVGQRFINAVWRVVALGVGDGTFVLGDRPLIRFGGFDAREAVWVLPLAPRRLFLAANDPAVLRHLLNRPAHRFCRAVNVSTALQAERYVFSTNPLHASWLGKYLGPRKGRGW